MVDVIPVLRVVNQMYKEEVVYLTLSHPLIQLLNTFQFVVITNTSTHPVAAHHVE